MKKIITLVVVLSIVAGLVYTSKTEAEDIKLSAWAVFETYLEVVKNHDVEGLKILSYQLSEDCLDESKLDKCKERMDGAYYFGQYLKLEDITKISYDKKQIILSTNYTKTIEPNSTGMIRSLIYFVRGEDGIKFLSIDPFDGVVTLRSNEATSTVEARLEEITKDSDDDYLPDDEENCSDTNVSNGCIKTNPKKKDTDGDGFWDSTEALFYKNPTQ
jgi:hypothetical protein